MLQKADLDYEVIFWNREAEAGMFHVSQVNNYIYINIHCNIGVKKFVSFLKWKRIVKNVIKKKKYNKLIILSTVPTVLLKSLLINNYSGRYIFDIRDYTLEKYTYFKNLVMSLVDHSCLTAISSKGYMKWLDDSPKIYINHNITVDNVGHFKAPVYNQNSPIRFSFVGNVRLDTQTKAMLISLGRSKRFEQHFYGRVLTKCDIDQIVSEKRLSNVTIHGPFNVDEKDSIYARTDLINAVYANSEKEEDIPLGDSTPLPNRLYDALVFFRPIVASKGTYLAELVSRYNLGINVNGFDKGIEKKIIDYIDNFDYEIFVNGCNELRADVVKEEKKFQEKINSILFDWKLYDS